MTSGLISSATGPWWRRSSAGCGITATPCTSKARRCASRKVEEETVENHPIGREEYIHQVLRAYRQTPGTTGTIRSPDRLLAAQLYARGVPLRAVENALVLAASRRLLRPTQAPPLSTIRSLAYFLPVIDEVLELPISPDYFRYLRQPPPQNRRLLFQGTQPADELLTPQTPSFLSLHAFGVGPRLRRGLEFLHFHLEMSQSTPPQRRFSAGRSLHYLVDRPTWACHPSLEPKAQERSMNDDPKDLILSIARSSWSASTPPSGSPSTARVSSLPFPKRWPAAIASPAPRKTPLPCDRRPNDPLADLPGPHPILAQCVCSTAHLAPRPAPGPRRSVGVGSSHP